jgi:hypothetical protein
MTTQTIQDNNGVPTGVFIPMENWNRIKKQYPDIEKTENDLPQWQKDILDLRLVDLDNPLKIKPIQGLYDILDQEI